MRLFFPVNPEKKVSETLHLFATIRDAITDSTAPSYGSSHLPMLIDQFANCNAIGESSHENPNAGRIGIATLLPLPKAGKF
jgi:hypothetical protein